MIPGAPISMNPDDDARLSYSGVYVCADRDRVLAELAELRFTGYLGPQEGAWVLAITGNPLGKVARKKRRVVDVARDLASTLATRTVAAEVERDSRLQLHAFDADTALPAYDSNPPEEDEEAAITLDEFGMPVMSSAQMDVDHEEVATALLAMFEVADDEGELLELLSEDLGEDTSESERLVPVLRLLGLPTWIVSSDSLPRRVPGGPNKNEVTRLGAGKAGVPGRFAEALSRPARPRPKKRDS